MRTLLGLALLVGAPCGEVVELPRPDLARNVFIVIVGKSAKAETTYDAEGEEVYSKLGPGRLYVRLWYDGPCAAEIHRRHDGWRPWMWNSPLDDQNRAYRSTDRRMRQWNQDGRTITGEERKLGNAADADLTPSGYAREAYDGMLEMAKRNAEGYLRARERGERYFILAGPNEFEYLFFDPEKFSADYSPFAVAEFRDWLTHRGEFARGGRFEGQGRAGGAAFADDPSPAVARGGNASFNATFKTSFSTWKLAYWDLDEFPDALSMDAQGMPGPRERGCVAGGFDAPRKPGAPLWERWQNRDPKDPGYRQWRIHQSLRAMFKVIRDAGVPREEIWSRQRHMHPASADYWSGKPNAVLADWVAITPDNMAGYNQYNLRPAERLEGMRGTAALARAAGAQYGTLEWHPSLGADFKATERQYLADLEGWYEAGARVIGCRQWLGMNGGSAHGIAAGAMRIRDTGFDTAIRKFLAGRPDRPWGSSPKTVYAPPRVRGLAWEGRVLSWKDELWDGEPYAYGAWEEFARFEVGTCAEVDAKGAPRGVIVLGSAREARFEVAEKRAQKYVVVRAVSRAKAASAWSGPVEAP